MNSFSPHKLLILRYARNEICPLGLRGGYAELQIFLDAGGP